MTEYKRFLLLDGAAMRGHALLGHAQQCPGAIALYGDMGESASAVGPWLLPGAALEEVNLVELPARHGASELQVNIDSDTASLVLHLRRIRHLQTFDGQRYYFRYADMRALAAMRGVLTAKQRSWVHGPILAWRFIDRYGEEQAFDCRPAPDAMGTSGELKLSAKQLGRLLDAGLSDQLCSAVEELSEPDLQPAVNPQHFRLVDQAADLIRNEGVESFVLQRSIACQAIRLGADIARSAEFADVIRAAKATGQAESVDRWLPRAQSGMAPQL